ncbi:class I SAM-dependent methyltransferase [Ferrimonas balearica]|uniref:class I SAM-dependent methyltransferase n=1 Tax=Ferrimonas balearica TaxID=44012 RepID=UPI001C992E4F|nr:class I SAM-dependent methyltransferase [Ferrimonas balearica]MBY5992766.1 class I SAM-dependent methyltransferase [Ferrimonas balearica]
MELYQRHARAYAEAIEDNLYNAQLDRYTLLRMLPPLDGLKVLDLACGPGAYLQPLFDGGAAWVKALDLSPQMVALVRERFARQLGQRLECEQQDLAQGLPQEPSAEYDLVICPLAVHYLADLAPLFRDVQRVLKPGGRFVFSTHHPLVDAPLSPSGNYFAVEAIEEQWNTIGTPVTVRFYRRPLEALFAALTQAGLLVAALEEGTPDPRMAEQAPEVYQRLRTQPNFLFLEAKKTGT